MEPTPTPDPTAALQRLQFIYDCARRAPLSADEHDRCKTLAQELAALLQPKPAAAPAAPNPVVEGAVAPFIPKDGPAPVATRRGRIRQAAQTQA